MNWETAMSDIFAVYGAAGCGRSLMPVAIEQLHGNRRQIDHNQVVFIDDALGQDSIVNGHIAMNYNKFKSLEGDKYILIAIANSAIRQQLADKIQRDGIVLWSVQSISTLIMDSAIIDAGAALSPFVTIAANVTIGKCFHANLYSYVEHDCVIGDYVTFAPRVSCNGNIHIHDHAYIGAGAVIKQGTPDKPLVIGKGAIVGMGAVVTKNVPAGAIVVGSPARPLIK